VYIIIAGGGREGYQLAKTFLALEHEVLLLDSDPYRCELIAEELGSVVMCRNPSEVQTLREAGASRADLVIAVTGRDEDNLAVCQICKELFKTPKTLALVNNPQNEALYQALGVDIVVNVTQIILSKIEVEIPGHPFVHLSNLRNGESELVMVQVPPDAAVVGKRMEEIVLPPNSFVSLVVKEEGPLLPDDDTVLEAEDEVVVVTNPEEEQVVWETLTGVQSG